MRVFSPISLFFAPHDVKWRPCISTLHSIDIMTQVCYEGTHFGAQHILDPANNSFCARVIKPVILWFHLIKTPQDVFGTRQPQIFFPSTSLRKSPKKNHGQDKHEHTKHHQHTKSILQHDGDLVPQSPTKSTSSSWFKKQAVTSLSKIETLRKKIQEISIQLSIHEIASKTNLNVNLSLPRPRQSRSGQNKYNKKRIKKSEMTTKTQTDKCYYTPPLSYNILSHICCR